MTLKHDAMEPLLVGTPFNYDDIEFERSELSCEEQYTIIENALRIDSRPALGLLVGEQVELSMHGVLGLAAMTSATLHEALMMFVKYHFLRGPFFSVRLAQENKNLVIIMANVDELPEDVSQFLLECYAAMMQSIVECIVGRTVSEASLMLPYPGAQRWPLYEEYFNCPVIRAIDNAIRYSIPLALADSPCPARDDTLHMRAEEGCKNLLQKIESQKTFRGKVEEVYDCGNGVFLTLEECAQLLHVSPRTLIRKLKSEGVNYQSIIEDSQKSKVVHLLGNESLSIDSIALQMGYEYAPNFRRAFKRWFGVTPSAYRHKYLEK